MAIVPARASGHHAAGARSPSAEELRQHEAMLDLIHKSSGGKAVWRAASRRSSQMAIERTEITEDPMAGPRFRPLRTGKIAAAICAQAS